MTFLNINLF